MKLFAIYYRVLISTEFLQKSSTGVCKNLRRGKEIGEIMKRYSMSVNFERSASAIQVTLKSASLFLFSIDELIFTALLLPLLCRFCCFPCFSIILSGRHLKIRRGRLAAKGFTLSWPASLENRVLHSRCPLTASRKHLRKLEISS